MGRVIGITGRAGSGKDTAARYLTDYYTRRFRTAAFADPIRSAMRAVFGWDDSYFTHPKKNEVDPVFGISPRKAMQTLGTEWGRNLINTDLWLILAGRTVDVFLSGGHDVLMTDCRFENEAEWIRKQGGFVLHIDRNPELIASGAGTETAHTSEAGVAFTDGDRRIDNNETLGYMFNELDMLVVDLAQAEQDAADAARLQSYADPIYVIAPHPEADEVIEPTAPASTDA